MAAISDWTRPSCHLAERNETEVDADSQHIKHQYRAKAVHPNAVDELLPVTRRILGWQQIRHHAIGRGATGCESCEFGRLNRRDHFHRNGRRKQILPVFGEQTLGDQMIARRRGKPAFQFSCPGHLGQLLL